MKLLSVIDAVQKTCDLPTFLFLIVTVEAAAVVESGGRREEFY